MAVPFLSFDLAKMTCDKFFMNSIVGPFQVYPFVHCMAGLSQVPNNIDIVQEADDWIDFYEKGNLNPAVAK